MSDWKHSHLRVSLRVKMKNKMAKTNILNVNESNIFSANKYLNIL